MSVLEPSTLPSSGVDAGSVEATCTTLIDFLDRLACLGKPHTMESLANTDLTFTQLRVLFTLAAHESSSESLSVNEIAEQIHLSLAAAGRTVDKLVGAGLVDRREDTADRRVKRVTLTADGQTIVDSHLTVKQDLIHAFVGGLPEDVRARLCAALDPIVDSAVDYFAGLGHPETTTAV
ncbi:MarR family transcriptional regulator [Gordonia sp. CPCC 205515]|uniref:MarR family winged helix-turn-helix transcriptional regulator n=1 Tax=Gordonia sp. CPCC 205515 TaxID=3140791 RepID=UPI003AF3E926